MANQLHANQQLNVTDHLDASNNTSRLIMQDDGNLVLYRSDEGRPIWASNTHRKPVNHAIMQGDGNFVCYDNSGHAFWATGTSGQPAAYIFLQDDSNLVVYGSNNTPLWASNTVEDFSRSDTFGGNGGAAISGLGLHHMLCEAWRGDGSEHSFVGISNARPEWAGLSTDRNLAPGRKPHGAIGESTDWTLLLPRHHEGKRPDPKSPSPSYRHTGICRKSFWSTPVPPLLPAIN